MHILKMLEFYTLNGRILWHMNCIAIKLLQEKGKKETKVGQQLWTVRVSPTTSVDSCGLARSPPTSWICQRNNTLTSPVKFSCCHLVSRHSATMPNYNSSSQCKWWEKRPNSPGADQRSVSRAAARDLGIAQPNE